LQSLDTPNTINTNISKKPEKQSLWTDLPGQTHLNPNTGRMLHDGVDLFPRETSRRYAAPKSNAFTLTDLLLFKKLYQKVLDL